MSSTTETPEAAGSTSDLQPCTGCGQPATSHTPTGHPVCRACLPSAPLLADTLNDLAAFIGRFVVFASSNQLVAVTLWAAHTHLVRRLRTTPYLHVTSPEPESGKSRVLDVLELVVHNPWATVTPSAAVLYRKIDSDQAEGGSTLLLDEVDPIFRRGARDDSAEALRAVLNAGYQKGRTVARCVPPRMDVAEFQVFGAKALAGIGDIPATIASRSIRIAMKRRKRSEPVEPLFLDEVEDEAAALKDRLALARDVSLADLPRIRRELLSLDLGDRAADGWCSLLAIAEEAGGAWPMKALTAAQDLHRNAADDSSNLGVRLLSDCRLVLNDWPHPHIFSSDLRNMLLSIEDGPWADHYGQNISQRKIAALLSPYEVRSSTRRLSEQTRKGYSITDFKDAWQRYLPNLDVTGVTSQAPGTQQAIPSVSPNRNVTDTEPHESQRVAFWEVRSRG